MLILGPKTPHFPQFGEMTHLPPILGIIKSFLKIPKQLLQTNFYCLLSSGTTLEKSNA